MGWGIDSAVSGFPGRHLSRWWKNYWVPSAQTSTSPGVTASSLITESSGTIGANASYHVSAPIPVVPGTIVAWWNDQQDILAPNKGGFYGPNGTTWIGGVHANGVYAGHRCLFRVPAGASFVRFNISSSTSPARKYWCGMRRAAAMKELATKIAFEGDSLTEGSTVYFDKSFPQVISDMTGIPVVNNSDGGRKISTSTGMQSTIRNTDHLAEIGVVMGGVNDYFDNVALGATTSADVLEFNGALNAMLSYLVNGRPWQKWYLVTPLPQAYLNPNAGGLNLRDYADAMVAAGLRYGVTVLDANKDLGTDIRQTMQGWFFSGDGIHLNWLSTDLVAQYILQGISNN